MKYSQHILLENVQRSVWGICMRISLGLKGLKTNWRERTAKKKKQQQQQQKQTTTTKKQSCI